MKIRTYSELILLPTFEERVKYLQLNGEVGTDTFGFDRYLNQRFYRSAEWKRIHDQVIIRDCGCDLGIQGREIFGKAIVHHMNPISVGDILNETSYLTNPEYLITTILDTHNLIHYGGDYIPSGTPTIRKPNDTIPWR